MDASLPYLGKGLRPDLCLPYVYDIKDINVIYPNHMSLKSILLN